MEEPAVTLSIVVPVYNELPTLPWILRSVILELPTVKKQIIIVDDCSTDGSREWLQEQFPSGECQVVAIGRGPEGQPTFVTARCDQPEPRSRESTKLARPVGETSVTVHLHERNIGKGGTLRTGFARVRGDVVVIQDADLEYDPADLEPMLRLITTKVADVVYGSRFYGNPHRSLYYHHYLGNRLICLLFNLLYNQTLSDIEVCYKMFRREVLDSISLICCDFGFEVEFSASVVKPRRWRIYEIGISYYGRGYEEGKKITWRDGVRALWYIVKFRF
jgi:glycosyltransferase involved in cell wall biosynthesis